MPSVLDTSTGRFCTLNTRSRSPGAVKVSSNTVAATTSNRAAAPSVTVRLDGSSETVSSVGVASSSRTSTDALAASGSTAYPDPESTVTVTVPCASSRSSSVIGV